MSASDTQLRSRPAPPNAPKPARFHWYAGIDPIWVATLGLVLAFWFVLLLVLRVVA